MSWGVGRRRGSDLGSDLAWLWLWRRLAATALIGPLAWEPPYAAGAALNRLKNKKNKSFIHQLKKKERLCIYSDITRMSGI